VSLFSGWEQVSPSPRERHVPLEAPTERQLALLEQVVSLHQRNGVIAGMSPLSPPEHCVHGRECWHGCPRPEWQGDVPLPWVGPTYTPGGVATIGLNLNDASGLLIEYEITERDFRSFRVGGSGASPRPSRFAQRSAYSARALLRTIDDDRPGQGSGELSLSDALRATARLQLVKCSPAALDRSVPPRAMLANCPETFLFEELDILRPGIINGLGLQVRSALTRAGADLRHEGSGVWIGSLSRAWGMVSVYCTPHPAAHGSTWQRGHERLIAYLACPR
jgi:hypothetical protein